MIENKEPTTLVIKASSKISTKIRDNFFTYEYGEERSIPIDCDIEKARRDLWDDVNYEVDKQIEEIWKLHKNG